MNSALCDGDDILLLRDKHFASSASVLDYVRVHISLGITNPKNDCHMNAILQAVVPIFKTFDHGILINPNTEHLAFMF